MTSSSVDREWWCRAATSGVQPRAYCEASDFKSYEMVCAVKVTPLNMRSVPNGGVVLHQLDDQDYVY